MSEEINNRQYRQEVIRTLLAELHAGKTVDEVKGKFKAAFSGVSGAEIAEAEQALVANGLPVTEVQRLCDVHAAVFRDSITPAVPSPEEMSGQPGHPVHSMREENRALEKLLEEEVEPALLAWQAEESALPQLRKAIRDLKEIHLHYLRKENLLFPYMEKHDITAPPKVMWGVDDEIRDMLKQAELLANAENPDKALLTEKMDEAIVKITEMIFKEENILFPMVLEALTTGEWAQIERESGEMGYFRIPQPPVWIPPVTEEAQPETEIFSQAGTVVLPTGVLKASELTHMLDSLPIDITFVDKNDKVKYFSQGEERVFPRTKAIIGRDVANCHPPASVHIVEGILDDFKSGKKSHEDFWIKMGSKYIYIRYYAVRDENDQYLGCLEVTQNIAPIQEITGEKRLVELS